MTRRLAPQNAGALLVVLATCARCAAAADPAPADPLFDMPAIRSAPLRAQILQETRAEGLVVRHVEFDGPAKDGRPVRVFGILALPEGGRDLPAVFWSQNGMAPASDYFPKFFAKRGYFCLNVTLDHDLWKSFAPFDTARPKEANLTQLAVAQLRGITYLASRPEVDTERIGVAGGSYGSFFSTLIAGADDRVKAGMGFFAAGHHELGTNLPQFTGLKTEEDVRVWTTTIDPAWRLKRRAVPFLWGVGSNDHWFQLPAIFRTYEESLGPKCLAVAVPWGHAAPAELDEQLFAWMDIHLKRSRPTFNAVGPLALTAENGRLVGRWSWTGANPVRRAELVASYGPARPWHQQVRRAHFVLPARIDGTQAVAEIPFAEPGFDVHCFASIVEADGARSTTLPQTVQPSALGLAEGDAQLVLDAYPLGDFEPDDVEFFVRSGLPVGTPDDTAQHTGKQCVRIDAGKSLRLGLYHVPLRSHRLSLWLKSDAAAAAKIEVVALKPENDHSPLVRRLRAEHAAGGLPHEATTTTLPTFAANGAPGADWQEIRLECPYAGEFLSGYDLVVRAPPDAPCRIDGLRFEPIWRR